MAESGNGITIDSRGEASTGFPDCIRERSGFRLCCAPGSDFPDLGEMLFCTGTSVPFGLSRERSESSEFSSDSEFSDLWEKLMFTETLRLFVLLLLEFGLDGASDSGFFDRVREMSLSTSSGSLDWLRVSSLSSLVALFSPSFDWENTSVFCLRREWDGFLGNKPEFVEVHGVWRAMSIPSSSKERGKERSVEEKGRGM